jgi:tripartite ATP-independent transporter DctM subunit
MILWFVLALLLLAGAPLFAVILGVAILGFYQSEVHLSAIAIEFYRIADMQVLIAVPLFTFGGYILGYSRAPQRLVNLTEALLGWLPGGLAIVALLACALFTAFTGASGVTIVALGALLYPALRQAGYPERFSLGLITTSGSLGLLFAPSLPIILYGVVAQQMSLPEPVSIDAMFLAGVLPGVLMILLLSLWSGSQYRLPRAAGSGKTIPGALRAAAWEIPLPLLVLVGIYGGWIAVSEAAALTALYIFVVEVLIRREISFAQLPAIVREAMTMVGGIMIILGASLASTNYMIDAEIPVRLFETITAHIDSRLTFLILLNIFLLLLGMLLDIFSAIILMVPLLLPVAMAYGIHPVHLGIIFLANMQIGYFTPPVGMNLFIASYSFNRPVLEICRAAVPFFFILLLAVLIITYLPWLSLALLP